MFLWDEAGDALLAMPAETAQGRLTVAEAWATASSCPSASPRALNGNTPTTVLP